MKAKALTSTSARVAFILVLVTVLALASACNRNPLGSSQKNDAQIASEVQTKVLSDPNVPSRQISVQSANGVVTLAGNVTSEQERSAAAQAAAQVEGVKTVVNNLQVQSANAAQQAPAPDQTQTAQEQPQREEPRQSSRNSARRATSTRGSGGRVTDYSQGSNSSASTGTSSGGGIGSSSSSAMSSTPAAPAVQKVTVPEGTTVSIRLIDSLDSEKNQTGDTFKATLNSPIVVEDNVVIPADADVQGHVVDAKSAGRFAGQSALAIEVTSISVNGHTYPIRTNQWAKQGTSRGKNTAAKVGGGAALGAIIGGIAGGGKGAAIGAGVGAGAGTGVQAIGHGQQIKLNSEAVVNFQLQAPVTVTPQSQVNRAGRMNQ